MALTDLAIRKTKPDAKQIKLSDSGGLQLIVTPKGAKHWRLAYRHHGKQKSLSLGSYPVVSLADARNARDAARKLLITGADPSLHRKLERQSAAVTFGLVGDELLEYGSPGR